MWRFTSSSPVLRLLISTSRVLSVVYAILLSGAAPAGADPIQGAGSTFAAPIIDRWSQEYEAARADGGEFSSPDWRVDYEPVGSLAGVMRLDQQDLDFAATDAPLSPDELSRRNLVQFPIVMGGIAVTANLDNVEPGQLRLPGTVLADIYLGRITRWSDPGIRNANPSLALPDAEIAVLHRLDGSGSTLAFTAYLSRNSPEWNQKVGSDTLVKWPHGRGERGTSALAALTAKTKNSISYLEYGQVVRARLAYVSLQTPSGTFVQPSQDSFRTALSSNTWTPSQGVVFDAHSASAEAAYPMTVVTYAVVPTTRGTQRINRVFDLFRLAFRSSSAAMELGYIPVPPDLAGQVETYWRTVTGSASN